MMRRTLPWLAVVAVVVLPAAIVRPVAIAAQAPAASLEQQVDSVFARWNAKTPGCAVGVSAGGAPVPGKAYGMADLEHDVANTADTIFEAGICGSNGTRPGPTE